MPGGHRAQAERRDLPRRAGRPADPRPDDGGRFLSSFRGAGRRGPARSDQRDATRGLEEAARGVLRGGTHRRRRDPGPDERRVQGRHRDLVQGRVGIPSPGGLAREHAGAALSIQPQW